MIENPPLIQIKKPASRNRPNKEQLNYFKDVPTGFICDALDGYAALDHSIKPLLIPGKIVNHIVGPALTVFSGAADVLGMAIALSEIQEGDIVVNSVSGFQGTAAVGDRIETSLTGFEGMDGAALRAHRREKFATLGSAGLA